MDPRERQQVESMLADLLALDTSCIAETFYRELFILNPDMVTIFDIGQQKRLAKFKNMLSIFSNLNYFEKKIPAYRALGQRHKQYGADANAYAHCLQALNSVLESYLGEFTLAQKTAWQNVWHELIEEMLVGSLPKEPVEHNELSDNQPNPMTDPGDLDELMDRIGGTDVIQAVHQRFYDALFDDAWLGKFFWGKNKANLIDKQTQFMCECMGSNGRYTGDTPAMIHMHMYITDEQFELRQHLLQQAILAQGLAADIAERWLALDDMFRQGIVKQSEDECVMKCIGQFPLSSKRPESYQWHSD